MKKSNLKLIIAFMLMSCIYSILVISLFFIYYSIQIIKYIKELVKGGYFIYDCNRIY